MGKVIFLERRIDMRLKDSHEQYEMRELSETLTVHGVCNININHTDEHFYWPLWLSGGMSFGICVIHIYNVRV